MKDGKYKKLLNRTTIALDQGSNKGFAYHISGGKQRSVEIIDGHTKEDNASNLLQDLIDKPINTRFPKDFFISLKNDIKTIFKLMG